MRLDPQPHELWVSVVDPAHPTAAELKHGTIIRLGALTRAVRILFDPYSLERSWTL